MENFILSTFLLSTAPLVTANTRSHPIIAGDDNGVHLKIAGGWAASDGEIPYQIMLKEQGNFVCGGSLSNVSGTQFVLTAAHCVSNGWYSGPPSRYTVVAGEVDSIRISGNEQTRSVTRIFAHKQFNSDTMENDIAVLAIDKPFTLNKYVSPIALPKPGQVTTGELIVSGYGSNNPLGINFYPYLKQVRLTVVDELLCKIIYLPHGLLPDSMLCAGNLIPGRDSCGGDSGGPVKAVNGSYLAGIVSWGTICGLPIQPGVNTKVSHYVHWIEQQAARI